MFIDAIGQTADMRSTPLGRNRKDGTLDSKTGYLVKKMIPENWNLNNAGSDSRFLNMPYMRMAEIYLNYAEAVNEASGPNGTAGGLALTGIEALNVLRRRVGHVEVNAQYTDSQDNFRELVRNEFRVELCFEYHTWFDQIRWRTAEEELNGVSFTQVLIEANDDLDTYPTGFKFSRGPIHLPRIFEKKTL
ncbi:RagB/SusD family nutrient uptake outer membrane protein [Zobellia nedashkovskayae]